MTQQNRETLLALADRAEKADGPCRELDAAIANASYDIGFTIYGERVRYDPPLWLERYGPITSSLDAAMSLVPEGLILRLYTATRYVPHGCEVALSWAYGGWIGESDHSFALALVAAALRATASSLAEHCSPTPITGDQT